MPKAKKAAKKVAKKVEKPVEVVEEVVEAPEEDSAEEEEPEEEAPAEEAPAEVEVPNFPKTHINKRKIISTSLVNGLYELIDEDKTGYRLPKSEYDAL